MLLEKHNEKHTQESRDCKDKKLSWMDEPTKITNDNVCPVSLSAPPHDVSDTFW